MPFTFPCFGVVSAVLALHFAVHTGFAVHLQHFPLHVDDICFLSKIEGVCVSTTTTATTTTTTTTTT